MSECLKDRRTGRSTGLALQYIADAYNKPGTRIKIKDHVDHPLVHIGLRQTIQYMVKQLELKGFEFNISNGEMKYQGLCNCDVIKQNQKIAPCTCEECGKAK